MSRFAADPRWLIYLPPTMSPCETSALEDYLEHPIEAFQYYQRNGVHEVVCERKHMGSRCVIVLCHTEEAAKKRFQVTSGRGIIYTRTGRRFFDDPETEEALLDRLDQALTKSSFWSDFGTDWVCLDAELLPWSEKAKLLLKTQYGPTGMAGRQSLKTAVELLKQGADQMSAVLKTPEGTSNQSVDLSEILQKYQEKQEAMDRYVAAYREYCWDINSIDDFRIAPFHLLAVEGKVFSDKTHIWHMETIKKYLVDNDPVFIATDHITVHVSDPSDIRKGIDWWLDLTDKGGEGMVVKPIEFIARDQRGILQPAIKCRGREYLRIIYGPEYLIPEHLDRLKKRSLSRKRGLALKEFALGMEALKLFADKEPLHRIHQCVFGVLALESEPVDPRL